MSLGLDLFLKYNLRELIFLVLKVYNQRKDSAQLDPIVGLEIQATPYL